MTCSYAEVCDNLCLSIYISIYISQTTTTQSWLSQISQFSFYIISQCFHSSQYIVIFLTVFKLFTYRSHLSFLTHLSHDSTAISDFATEVFLAHTAAIQIRLKGHYHENMTF